jgi:hypothetical protein
MGRNVEGKAYGYIGIRVKIDRGEVSTCPQLLTHQYGEGRSWGCGWKIAEIVIWTERLS